MSRHSRVVLPDMQLIIKLVSDESWGLVELQGVLETQDGQSYDNLYIGDLHFDVNGVPSLLLGHHLLTGKVVTLDQPMVVFRNCTSAEYNIVAVITKKIIFKNRPKPLVGL